MRYFSRSKVVSCQYVSTFLVFTHEDFGHWFNWKSWSPNFYTLKVTCITQPLISSSSPRLLYDSQLVKVTRRRWDEMDPQKTMLTSSTSTFADHLQKSSSFLMPTFFSIHNSSHLSLLNISIQIQYCWGEKNGINCPWMN